MCHIPSNVSGVWQVSPGEMFFLKIHFQELLKIAPCNGAQTRCSLEKHNKSCQKQQNFVFKGENLKPSHQSVQTQMY